MTASCDEVITSALAKVDEDWTCRPLDNGWLLVTTSHQYSDGDHVELLVRGDNGSVVVSDGGEALARLDLAGVSIDHGRARDTWRLLLKAHELELRNERLSVQGPLDDAGSLVSNMANAVANIDGIRLLVAPPRSPRFADRLVTFFQAEFEYVVEGPQLRGRSEALYRATAAVGDPGQETFVQAVAGKSIQIRQRAIEHAFTMFSDVNGALPQERKLAVLSEGEWKPEQTRLLATVAYIGSWSSRNQIVHFIRNPKGTPSHILMPTQSQVPLE
jgi:Domain of unknown function DUF1828